LPVPLRVTTRKSVNPIERVNEVDVPQQKTIQK